MNQTHTTDEIPRRLMADDVWAKISPTLKDYRYDHYLHYPTKKPDGWKHLLRDRIRRAASDPDANLILSDLKGLMLIAVRARRWDKDHFGFALGSLEVLFSDGSQTCIDDCLSRVLSVCAANKIKFVSARVNGDQLEVIHALEAIGFRFYENIIWPVVSCRRETSSFAELGVRLMRSEDVASISAIADENQFARGHFNCDPGFLLESVKSMYGRWVRTAFDSEKPILVVESDGTAAGYFVLDLPTDISQALDVRYGRMRSLGLDAKARGKGLGQRLFRGALAWMRDQGCEFVDSGYASKNHISARLHVRAGFISAYEEVTLHRWS